jgi:hypothetical protein
MAGKETLKTWTSLTELLEKAMNELQRRKANSAQKLLIDFIKRSAGFGYGRLARVAKTELRFLKDRVLPDWDEEGFATLSFSLGALLEKMQQETPGPQFDTGLPEILSFLDILDEPEVGVSPADSQEREGPPPIENVATIETLPGAEFPTKEHRDEEHMDSRQLTTGPSTPPRPLDPTSMASRQANAAGGGGDSDYVIDRADWYQDVLREDPSSILFCDLAEELCARGLWQEAVRILRRGLHHHPRHVRGYALLGWALWEYGSAEEAETALTLARREIEKCAVVYRVLGEISTHQGAITEASRLNTIHSLMNEGMTETETPWLPVPVSSIEVESAASATPEDLSIQTESVEGKTSRLLSFLGALRDTVGENSFPESLPLALFTDSDRLVLEQLIHVHSGSL